MKLAVAATLIAGAFGVSGAVPTAAAGTAPTDSAAAETSVVPLTSPESVPDTVTDTTVDTTVDTTADTVTDTTADTGEVPGSDADTASVDDDGQSVSIWWWIGGVAVAAAAAYGIAYGLRRRTAAEDWARHASVACDIGRATSLTLLTQLDEPVWSQPARYAEQHQRFSEHLAELRSSVPDQDFPELLDAVIVASDRLSEAVAQLHDGAPITSARSTIEPAIDDLAIALDSLERAASVTVFGAALPSSRTTS